MADDTEVIELDATWPAQDYVVIGGDISPGKAIVRNTTSPRGWDVRQSWGLTGATVYPKGDEPGTFDIEFQLWNEADIPKWYAYAAKYFDKSVRFVPGSTQPKALGIYHPALSAPPIRITACVVVDADELKNDGDGLWTCTIKFLQYRKPKPVLQPPDAIIPAANKPKPTAKDAAEREIQQKSDQAGQLWNQLVGP